MIDYMAEIPRIGAEVARVISNAGFRVEAATNAEANTFNQEFNAIAQPFYNATDNNRRFKDKTPDGVKKKLGDPAAITEEAVQAETELMNGYEKAQDEWVKPDGDLSIPKRAAIRWTEGEIHRASTVAGPDGKSPRQKLEEALDNATAHVGVVFEGKDGNKEIMPYSEWKQAVQKAAEVAYEGSDLAKKSGKKWGELSYSEQQLFMDTVDDGRYVYNPNNANTTTEQKPEAKEPKDREKNAVEAAKGFAKARAQKEKDKGVENIQPDADLSSILAFVRRLAGTNPANREFMTALITRDLQVYLRRHPELKDVPEITGLLANQDYYNKANGNPADTFIENQLKAAGIPEAQIEAIRNDIVFSKMIIFQAALRPAVDADLATRNKQGVTPTQHVEDILTRASGTVITGAENEVARKLAGNADPFVQATSNFFGLSNRDFYVPQGKIARLQDKIIGGPRLFRESLKPDLNALANEFGIPDELKDAFSRLNTPSDKLKARFAESKGSNESVLSVFLILSSGLQFFQQAAEETGDGGGGRGGGAPA